MTYRATKITDFETKVPSLPERQQILKPRPLHSPNALKGFKIQVTNSFAVQVLYLSQFLDYAAKNSDRPRISRPEYVAHLGLTKRHTEALCSVAVAFDLVTPHKLTITQIGKTIAEGDPYIEYAGTLWILHYIISSNKKWLIWNTLINEIFPAKQQITSGDAKAAFDHLREKLSKLTMTKKIQREIAIVLDTYTTKAFSKLAIIQKKGNIYTFRKTEHIPPEILAAITLIFRQRYDSNASGISMEALIRAPNSPGRILNLEENTMRKILEQAHHKGLLYIERKADLDQIRFKEGLTTETILKMYYEGLRNETR
jgi:hypothetical protein